MAKHGKHEAKVKPDDISPEEGKVEGDSADQDFHGITHQGNRRPKPSSMPSSPRENQSRKESMPWQRATRGTYGDRAVPKAIWAIFAVAALALVLVPSLGMIWAPTDSTTENRPLVEAPPLTHEDGTFNEDYLAGWGQYFDDHFAYRNQAVTANARMRSLLGVSATDQVIVGSDGWLFYGGTLPDYLGEAPLSDRALAAIAHNLSLVQDFVESQNGHFLFTIAPNKNSLDWQAMPYYYLRYYGLSNAERLEPYLTEAGVNYRDLFSFFGQRMEAGERFHYLKEDSHWDNYWALLATDGMLEALDRDVLPVDATKGQKRPGFVGDLESMLYPTSLHREDNYYYTGYNDEEGDRGATWSYEEGSDVEDSFLRTSGRNEEAEGSLLMFRDSFGNALIPFWASQFQEATFSKLIPYNLTQLTQKSADCVVIERAERHLAYLASNPPAMVNPRYEGMVLPQGSRSIAAEVILEQSGAYWTVDGTFDEELDPHSDLRVVAELADGRTFSFDPFWTVSDSEEEGATGAGSTDGFRIYAATNALDLSTAVFTVYAF